MTLYTCLDQLGNFYNNQTQLKSQITILVIQGLIYPFFVFHQAVA